MFFSSAEQAWHDTYSTIKKSTSDMTFCGGGNLDGYKTYMAELAKIKRVVDRLPSGQHHAGMILFAPEIPPRSKTFIYNLVLDNYLSTHHKRASNATQRERMAMLVMLTINEARLKSAGRNTHKLKTPLAQLAQCLNLKSASQFKRDWQGHFNNYTEQLISAGYDALKVVESEVKNINRRYNNAA